MLRHPDQILIIFFTAVFGLVAIILSVEGGASEASSGAAVLQAEDAPARLSDLQLAVARDPILGDSATR